MSNDRMTNVPDFLGELDAGVFINKIAGALNTAALGVLNNGSKGKVSEEDTTETPMFVNRGGKLTILQEDQGNLFTLGGEPDAKLRTAP